MNGAVFRFACPVCGAPLAAAGPQELRCPADGTAYCQVDGVWRCLPPQLSAKYERFIPDYEQVRRAEGRGSEGDDFYRALPFQDLSGHFTRDWQIRARSFQALMQQIVAPLEKRLAHPLLALDLGAGNGWLSYRLAQRGHQAAAVDLLTNPWDGLGAWTHFDASFTPVQADFDHLPFEAGQMDLVIFNASLHYSTHYETSLGAAWNLLQPGGTLVILDSPIYHRAESGVQMVREREEQFQKAYGFRSNGLDSENFLTTERLSGLEAELGVRWQMARPFYSLEWALRPWKARLLGRREPASFALVYASKEGL